MTFTKEQRLKGLMKQLKNLGYDVQKVGGSVADESPDMDAEVSSPQDRWDVVVTKDPAVKKQDELQRLDEAF